MEVEVGVGAVEAVRAWARGWLGALGLGVGAWGR